MSSVEAAALFVVLIGPGFIYLRTYNRFRREVGSIASNRIAEVAQPLVASVMIIGLVWWPIAGNLIDRLSNLDTNRDIASDHVTWILIAALFGIGFFGGILLGKLVGWAAPRSKVVNSSQFRRGCHALFDALGLYQIRTLWEQIADKLDNVQAAFLRVRFEDGSFVHGTFAENSHMDVAPSPPALYLERAWYIPEGGEGKIEPAPEGAYVDAVRIVSLEILETT